MSALLIDAGNTRLKWGVAVDGEIHRTGNVPMLKIQEQGLGALTATVPRDVAAVMISNVAGQNFATRLAGWLGAHCGCDVQFARTTRTALGVTNGYKQPRRMGVDRWMAILGAWTEVEAACLVVDAGTAVTIDAIDDDGVHLGGQILPGLHLMTQALAANTSEIPHVIPKNTALFDGPKMFAENTRAAVISGALGAVIGAIERAAATLAASSPDATLVLTGGDASRILQPLGESPIHRPHLVLQGLMHLLDAS